MTTRPKVEIYTAPGCLYCVRAKRLLDHRGIEYIEYDVSADKGALERLQAATTRRTFPQIFIEGDEIGGCDDLHRLDRDGSLERLLGK